MDDVNIFSEQQGDDNPQIVNVAKEENQSLNSKAENDLQRNTETVSTVNIFSEQQGDDNPQMVNEAKEENQSLYSKVENDLQKNTETVSTVNIFSEQQGDDNPQMVNEAKEESQSLNSEAESDLQSNTESAEINSPRHFDSFSDVKDESVPKKKITLPYFQLPKPDLDEFLMETDKNLQSKRSFPQKKIEIEDRSNITFLIEEDKNEICRNSPSYKSMLSSIEELDDSRSPGVKRLVLKRYLLNKIQEKKKWTFEKSKEIAKLDEEMEEENEVIPDSDSSVDEEESFGKPENEFDDECSNSVELSINDDSDDDICLRKNRTVHKLSSDDEEEEETGAIRKEEHRKKYELDSDADTESHRYDAVSKFSTQEKSSAEYLKGSDDVFSNKNIDDQSSDDDSVDEFNNNGVFKEKDNTDVEKDHKKDTFQSLKSSDFQSIDEEGLAICSSIPSYQPGGGFHSDEDEEEPKKCETMSDFRSSSPVVEEVSCCESSPLVNNLVPTFGLDPPLSELGKSQIFSSQDLAHFCSGAFKTQTASGEDVSLQKEFDIENQNKEEELSEEKVQDFFDVEAELSGDDDGIDDDQELDDDDESKLLVVEDDELPAEEELRDEIADLHMKRMRDDDEELLKEMKEKFLDDGELNNDGTGRTRRFAWKNNDLGDSTGKDRDSSSDSDSSLDETWSSMCKEKAKWLKKNEEEEVSEEVSSSHKKLFLKLNIIGKPEFGKKEENCPKSLTYKRPRGSFLHMDESCQVLKKLRTSEDGCDGSRTTKHFVFRNEAVAGNSRDLVSKDIAKGSLSGSVFNVMS